MNILQAAARVDETSVRFDIDGGIVLDYPAAELSAAVRKLLAGTPRLGAMEGVQQGASGASKRREASQGGQAGERGDEEGREEKGAVGGRRGGGRAGGDK